MYDLITKKGTLVPTALAVVVAVVLAIACVTASGAEFNGTIYHLGERQAEVTVPVNASKMNLTLPEKVESMTLTDDRGRSVTINSSYQFRQGDFIYSLDFGRSVKGNLSYNLTTQGQQFVLPIKDSRPVRIILPEGYATGDRLLGIARPPPDEISTGDAGSVLTWNNTTSISYIEVDYYRKNAPQALMIIISILALAALALLVQYYISIRKLRASRMMEEEEEIQ